MKNDYFQHEVDTTMRLKEEIQRRGLQINKKKLSKEERK